MTASDVLAAFQQRGIVLAADGEQIRYRAPTGVITADDRAALHMHKAALLALLTPTHADEAPLQETTPATPVERRRPAAAPRRRGPKEQFSHDPVPITVCPACSGRAWRLRSTPRTGGAWLWVCAACADRVAEHQQPPAP